MQFRLATAAATVALLLVASATVFAADRIAQDDVCTGSKPFREVAQDETRTMAELCAIQEERFTRRSRVEGHVAVRSATPRAAQRMGAERQQHSDAQAQ